MILKLKPKSDKIRGGLDYTANYVVRKNYTHTVMTYAYDYLGVFGSNAVFRIINITRELQSFSDENTTK